MSKRTVLDLLVEEEAEMVAKGTEVLGDPHGEDPLQVRGVGSETVHSLIITNGKAYQKALHHLSELVHDEEKKEIISQLASMVDVEIGSALSLRADHIATFLGLAADLPDESNLVMACFEFLMEIFDFDDEFSPEAEEQVDNATATLVGIFSQLGETIIE